MGDFIDVRRLRPGDVFRPPGGLPPRRASAVRHVNTSDLYAVVRYFLTDGTCGTADYRAGTRVERLMVLDTKDFLSMADLFMATAQDGDSLTYTIFDGKLYT